MPKKVSAAAKRHADYMVHTLAPDLLDSGAEGTANDVRMCGIMMQGGRTDSTYARWLKTTLIPDLRASGKKLTANDLARCAKAITPPVRRKRRRRRETILVLGRRRRKR